MADHLPEAYPLQWPIGWPRAKYGVQSPFGNYTLFVAREMLEKELRLLGARSVVLSTNVKLRQDGLPYSSAPEPRDPGAAVYFRLGKDQSPRVLACDRWNRVASNIRAIAKHIESIRGQARWGVGSIEQAFAGYKSLTAMGAKKPWRDVLGMTGPVTLEQAKAKYRELQRLHHPDAGGDGELAAAINQAYAEAEVELR